MKLNRRLIKWDFSEDVQTRRMETRASRDYASYAEVPSPNVNAVAVVINALLRHSIMIIAPYCSVPVNTIRASDIELSMASLIYP